MADVRSLLKNERAARKIQHKHASYATTGTLLCTVCRLQLKSDSLWEGHLRSAGHIMRLQKLEDSERTPDTAVEPTPSVDGNKKKRKASSDDEDTDTIRKRAKAVNSPLERLSDEGAEPAPKSQATPLARNETQIPSRPATPLKPQQLVYKRPDVDEDEWAAFEADIATVEVPQAPSYGEEGVISAPAMSAAELAAKDKEEDNRRKRERQEAELEGDKEDAARRMEEELTEIESLEQRVKKLKDMKEALAKKREAQSAPLQDHGVTKGQVVKDDKHDEGDDDDDEEEEDDEWDGFRMKG